MKKLIFKIIVAVIFASSLNAIRAIVYNHVALLQMTNYNQSLVYMNSFNLIYNIVIYGLVIILVRDIYKTLKETKEKNK